MRLLSVFFLALLACWQLDAGRLWAWLPFLALLTVAEVWTLGAGAEDPGARKEAPWTQGAAAGDLQRVCDVYQSLFQDNLAVMLIVDRTSGRILEANASAERFYGYARDQLLGMTMNQINCMQGGARRNLLPESMYYRQDHYLYRHRLASGEAREVAIHASPVRALGNRVFLLIVHDVTERVLVEEELRKANEEMSRLVRAIAAMLVVLDGEDRVVRWNDSAYAILGINQGDALGRSLDDLALGWEAGKIAEGLAQCRRTRQPVSLERIHYDAPGGDKKTVKVNIFPLPEDIDGRIGVLMLGEDTTEREFLQSQLAQAQKLQSIGQLAAGIAHEINTPTQYVGNNVSFLQEAFGDLMAVCAGFRRLLEAAKSGPVPQELIREIEKLVADRELGYLEAEVPNAIGEGIEGVKRIATIVRSMKQFAHPGAGEMASADLNEAMRSTVVVSRNEWKYVAVLEEEYDPGTPMVLCMIGEINQVVLNLIINAAHAIGDAQKADPERRGRIVLRTLVQEPWVEIQVADNGTGIPAEAQARIFDPFFTTKEVGRGTGQGLAIARGIIVDKHKGQIFFKTEPGRGTTFFVRLPLGQGG